MRIGTHVMQVWPLTSKGRVGTVIRIAGVRVADMSTPETVEVEWSDGVSSSVIHVDNLAGMEAIVKTTYVGPRGLQGSKVIVRGPKGQRTYPYDHSAYDAHTTAAESYATDLLGMSGASATRIRYTRSHRGFVIGLSYA